LPALASELVDAHVAVIAATGGFQPAVAAKAATSTIPIVFTGGGDPVQFGLVASLARPGGNATGAINFSPELTKKRLELLRELVGNKGMIGVLSNVAAPNAEMQVRDVQDAADAIGQPIKIVEARSSDGDFSRHFDELVHAGVTALFVIGDPVFTSRRAQLVTLAAQHSLPASYAFRDFALAGGLMSYGADLLEVHRQAGVYTGRILKGSIPADLPVLRPTKFDFVVNAKTAKALGIDIPDKLIALANEVIE
jgi:putative tryptophan/tyrosine transport system substrate-binding protein